MRSILLAGCVLLSLVGPASGQFYRPWGYGGYGYPGYGYGSPYGIYYHPRSNNVTYLLPPIYAPAELAYGPGAMKQFMGVDRNFALGPLANPDPINLGPAPAALPPALPAPAAPAVAERPAAVPRVSNFETRLLATKFVAYGDTRFKKGEWSGALERYRTATTLAPDLAEARLKQAIVLMVLDRPEDAISSLKSALALHPTAAERQSAFEELYGDRGIAREAHLEGLARTAFAAADDPRPYLLLGYWFLAEGNLARAKKFLTHAVSLGGEHVELAKSLLVLTDGERL